MPGKRKNPYAVDETVETVVVKGKSPSKKTKSKAAQKRGRKTGELAQLKKLIVKLIKKFEKDLANPEDFIEFWGEKESPVSVISKLSQILLKLFAVNDSEASRKSLAKIIQEEVTEEDFAMMGEYFFKNNKA